MFPRKNTFLFKQNPIIGFCILMLICFVLIADSQMARFGERGILAAVLLSGLISFILFILIISHMLSLLMNSKKGFVIHCGIEPKRFIPIMLLLALFFMPSAKAQIQEALPLSMEQAIDSALKNNTRLRIAELRIEQANSERVSAWDIKPTELSYKQGQMYSPETDKYISINQNFGSLLAHIQRSSEAKIYREYQASSLEILKDQVSAETKSAYMFWQFSQVKTSLLNEKMEMFKHMAEIADLRYAAGDISLLEKTIATTEVSKIINDYQTAFDELAMAQLKLMQMMMVSGEFYPTKPEPEMYMILKSSDTSGFGAGRIIQHNQKKYEMVRAHESVVKSYYFPEISAGYFNQQIGDLHGLEGWQLSLAFPLWIPKQQADIKQARIESEITLNELEYQKFQLNSTVEILIFELNRYFKQIRHYTDVAMPQAELILTTANLQLDTEDIDYFEYLNGVSQAFQIETDYYQAIDNYNQTAIQLELYGN